MKKKSMAPAPADPVRLYLPSSQNGTPICMVAERDLNPCRAVNNINSTQGDAHQRPVRLWISALPPAPHSLRSNSLKLQQDLASGTTSATYLYSDMLGSQLMVSQDETLVSMGLECRPQC